MKAREAGGLESVSESEQLSLKVCVGKVWGVAMYVGG